MASDPSKLQGEKRGGIANLTNAGKGRPKGVPNKATADVKALAGKYSPAAIKELARLAVEAESEAARVSAIKELLDRAHGKSMQQLGDGNGDPVDWVGIIKAARGRAE